MDTPTRLGDRERWPLDCETTVAREMEARVKLVQKISTKKISEKDTKVEIEAKEFDIAKKFRTSWEFSGICIFLGVRDDRLEVITTQMKV